MMKASSIVGSVLAVSVLMFAGCGGSGSGGLSSTQDAACEGVACAPEGDPDDAPPPVAPLTCGRGDDLACPTGYRCIDDPAANCDPFSGVDCRGLCVLGEALPDCGSSGEACPEGYACVDDPDDACAGGPAVDCPAVCQPMTDGGCTADDECRVPDAPCIVCADGSLSCVTATCVDGECVVDSNPCSEAQVCGGISGLSCERGFDCVDDPTDECDPDRGDADCRGICIPDSTPPPCGGFDGKGCPPGLECADDPNDDCNPQDGGADCPGICEPPAGEECASNDDCPPSRAPCTVCADGNESCPRSFCDHGRCNVVFPDCSPFGGCNADGDCAPGEVCVPGPDELCDPATGVECSGTCVPDDTSRSCGGVAGGTCPDGHQCAHDRSDDCHPDEGADCPGICVPIAPAECVSNSECAAVEICHPCPDGNLSCPTAECLNGRCAVTFTPCPDPGFCGGFPGLPCPPGLRCVDDRGDDCHPDDGDADCRGVCVPGSPSECSSDGDCAAVQSCRACPDGSFSCPSAACVNGTCLTVEPGCVPADFCGGIAGVPCPPGFTCVDDDGDDCDPKNGGADCGGVCLREPGPSRCGGFAGETCAEGYECVDVPDDCDPATGADCPGYCRPIPGPSCDDDADCPVIAAPCRMCPDGTAACPRALCEAGECKADFPDCGAAMEAPLR